MTQDFTVTKDEGVKALPLGTKRFTQQDNGAEAYLLEGTNDPTLVGELIARGVPYMLTSTTQYYVRAPKKTAIFGIVGA
jgi:hypothetical protein